MKVIMTGGSGFVGKNLSLYLQRKGMDVFNISLRNDDWKTNLIDDYSCIIHLAGKAHDTSNLSDLSEYYRVNRDLTIELFEKFISSNVKDFFYFSSVKAASDSVDGILYEDVLAKPSSPYGISKMEAENYLLMKELPFGKRLFIIRPCMIHGPGNKGNLNLLYNIVKKGIPWPLGSFDNNRSFLSIDNLNFLIERMINNSTIRSGIYNFSDDGSMSTNELVRIISECIGNRGKIWNINKNIIENFAKIGSLISFPLNSERLKKLTESYLVSNQKIKDEIGVKHLPVSIEDGLRKTIKSFIQQN